MTDPIEQIVRRVLARSPIATRAQHVEPHYATRVATTLGALRAVHRAAYGVLDTLAIERVVTDLLLHPEGLRAADLAMREQAIEYRRAEVTSIPGAILLESQPWTETEVRGVQVERSVRDILAGIEIADSPIREIARRYDVDLDEGMSLDEAVTRIVEQVRCRG